MVSQLESWSGPFNRIEMYVVSQFEHKDSADISKISYPKNWMKIRNLFKISQVKKILRKAQVFSWFFDSWGFTGLHSLLQFTTSKNAEETCAFLKIFLSWKFLNKSHIFPPFPGSENADIITHIFKVFWSIFWIGKFWDVCIGKRIFHLYLIESTICSWIAWKG